jgi:hypothetical protein
LTFFETRKQNRAKWVFEIWWVQKSLALTCLLDMFDLVLQFNIFQAPPRVNPLDYWLQIYFLLSPSGGYQSYLNDEPFTIF